MHNCTLVLLQTIPCKNGSQQMVKINSFSIESACLIKSWMVWDSERFVVECFFLNFSQTLVLKFKCHTVFLSQCSLYNIKHKIETESCAYCIQKTSAFTWLIYGYQVTRYKSTANTGIIRAGPHCAEYSLENPIVWICTPV